MRLGDQIVVRVGGRAITKGSGEGTRAKRDSYDHGAAGEWQAALRLGLRRVAPRQPWRYGVRLEAYLIIHDRTSRVPGHREPMLVPPDADKLLRFVQDEAEGLIYVSDAQVYASAPVKLWSRPGDPAYAPGVVLRFTDTDVEVPDLPAWALEAPDMASELTAAAAARAGGAR